MSGEYRLTESCKEARSYRTIRGAFSKPLLFRQKILFYRETACLYAIDRSRSRDERDDAI